MAEAREERDERGRSRRRRLQERFQHAVQRPDAALPRHRRAVLVLPLQQLGGESPQSAGHEELPVAREPAGARGAGEPPPGLRQLLQHGDVDGRGGRRRHERRGRRRRGRRRGAVPVHRAAQPVQRVPHGAVPRDVVVDRVAAAQGQAALVVRRRLRRRVARVARGLGAAVGVPVRVGRRGGPRALRGGARPRAVALARAAAGGRARVLVAARARRARPRARPVPPPVGVVRLSARRRLLAT